MSQVSSELGDEFRNHNCSPSLLKAKKILNMKRLKKRLKEIEKFQKDKENREGKLIRDMLTKGKKVIFAPEKRMKTLREVAAESLKMKKRGYSQNMENKPKK